MKSFFILTIVFLYTFQLAGYTQNNLNCYFGNIHSHTDYSGGVGVPLHAFAYAKNVAGIDFLAVTDHLENIYYSSYEWDSTKISANLSTVNGTFISMTGFEWTSPTINHVNVFNTQNMVSPLNVNNWDNFLSDLQNEPNAIAQFNHPGLLATNNWNNFSYKSPAIDSIFRLIEVKKISDDSYYQMALNNGWHVSPTNNQDNHEWNWGTLDDKRTGIWCEDLTYNSIINSILKRKTFSTEDKNAKIWMECNNVPMGEFANANQNSFVRIKLQDSDGELWNQVQIIGSNNTTIFSGSFSHSGVDTVFNINTEGLNWIFVRTKQPDGDYLWSAPVFLNPSNSYESATILKEEFKVFPNPANDVLTINLNCNCNNKVPFRIFDITGNLMQYSEVHMISGLFKIDVGKLESGSYVISVNSNSKNYFLKFIILR